MARLRAGMVKPIGRDQQIQYNRVARETAREIRERIIEVAGGRCARCGFDDVRALQIDHVRPVGKHHKDRRYGVRFFRRVLESVVGGEGEFQVLCANCNWIKRLTDQADIQTLEAMVR